MATVSKRPWTYKGELRIAWVVRYTDETGKKRLKSFKTKREADRARLEIETEIDLGSHVPARATQTVAVALDTWLRDCDKRRQIGDRMTRSTIAMYQGCAKRIEARFGRLKLTDIGPANLQDLADHLATRLSPVTVKHTFMALSLMFDHAISIKWVKRNPVKDHRTRLPRKERTMVIPSRADLQRLLDAARERQPGELVQAQKVRYAALCLALFGGLRRGEVCGLKWGTVDLGSGKISVRNSLSRLDGLKTTKTKNGIREVPMVQPVREALEDLTGPRRPDDYVLTSTRQGTPIQPNDMTNLYWRLVCKKAGLVDARGRPAYRLHSIRHAAASLFIASGLSPLHVKTVIGHASIQTTLNIYGHLFPEDAAIGNAAAEIAGSFRTTREAKTAVSA